MFEFNEDDLKANKRGQFSPRQRSWLNGIARGTRKFSWRSAIIAIGFTLVGLCLMLALYLQNESSRKALFSSPVNLIVLAAVIPLVMGIMALAIFVNYRNANKLENAVVSSVSGPVRCDSDSSGESGLTTYLVIVGNKKFKFGDDTSSKFQEGEKYKFYYCKAGLYEFVMSYERSQ
ncbi:MAG: hypothetical protein QM730_00575 [Anaerolineales bacterium]